MVRRLFVLLAITLIAALLRFFNFSPFTVYPDSFQNIIVADNIRTYGSVTGFLGANGMFYPDFFMWTRPLYPLLIDIVSFFGLSPLLAARSIAFVLGILAIPVAYLFVKEVFAEHINKFQITNNKSQINSKSKSQNPKNIFTYLKISIWNFFAIWDLDLGASTTGLTGAFLLALSYNHSVWSGLLMTEAIGVFFMLFFLWQFFSTVAKRLGFLSLQTMFTGFLFALAILARYEYFIVAVPVVIYALKKAPKPVIYLTSMLGTAVVTLVLVGIWLYPVGSLISVVSDQLSGLLVKFVIVIGLLVILFLLFWFSKKHVRLRFATLMPSVISILVGMFFLLFFLLVGTGSSQVFGLQLSMFTEFFRHDFLISLFAFIGILKMLEEKKQQALAYFVLLSVVLLGFVYYQINPAMERYMTHLIPFLVIPAVFGIQFFFHNAYSNQTKTMRNILTGIILLFVVSQLIITARGLRNLSDPSWYRVSYQEKVAELTARYLQDKPMLITSLPEPYYYVTGLDTQSIADTYPYLYIPTSVNNKTVVVVEDMGMHDNFPNFTKVLDTKLQKYKFATFWVHEQYHSTDQSIPEKYPVELYKIRLGTLKKVVSGST